MSKLKYANYYIGYQEVPNEISLCINISGCPYKCEGCHSKYLWEYNGNYIDNDLDNIVKKYSGMLTCVCFMGGDQNLCELNELLLKVKSTYYLKTCVYSGSNDINVFNNTKQHLDYLKVGSFEIDLGGLDKQTTNQKFYKIDNSNLVEITYKFKKN